MATPGSPLIATPSGAHMKKTYRENDLPKIKRPGPRPDMRGVPCSMPSLVGILPSLSLCVRHM